VAALLTQMQVLRVDRAAVVLITLELREQGIRQVRHLHKDLQEAPVLHRGTMAALAAVAGLTLSPGQAAQE
jgi:hypothetical protein